MGCMLVVTLLLRNLDEVLKSSLHAKGSHCFSIKELKGLLELTDFVAYAVLVLGFPLNAQGLLLSLKYFRIYTAAFDTLQCTAEDHATCRIPLKFRQ